MWSSGAEFRKAERTVCEEYPVVEMDIGELVWSGRPRRQYRPADLEGAGCPAEVCRHSAVCSRRESSVRVRVSGQVGWSRARYGERKHDGRWLSTRCPICCRRDLLRRVGVRRCAVGPSVGSRFVRIWLGCLGKQYSLFRLARGHYQSGVLGVRSVCAHEDRQ